MMFPYFTEIILLGVIVLLVFGMGKLPDIARTLGRMRSEFDRGLKEGEPIDITPDEPEAIQPEESGKKKASDVEDATYEE